jgi:hypothetical protein
MLNLVQFKNIYMKLKDNKKIFFYILLIIFLGFYRYFWSLTPSWQVVGVSRLYFLDLLNLFEAKVGLLSSKNIPMPNGMIFLAYLLKPINNLIIISFVISIIQLFLIYLLVRETRFNNIEKLLFFLALSTSSYISNMSVHLLNQWIVINFSIFFFYLFLKFERTKQLNTLAMLYIVSVIPPSIYLGGIVTSLFMISATIYITFKNTDILKKNKREFYKRVYVISFFYFLFFIFSWLPYIATVDLSVFKSLESTSENKLFSLIKNSYLFPFFFLDVFTEEKSFYIRFLEPAVISDNLQLIKVFYIKLHEIIINYLVFLIFIFIKNKKLNQIKRIEIILPFLFIFIFTIITPLFGGNNFYKFNRMDQFSEMYIYFLIIMFSVLFSFKKDSLKISYTLKSDYIKNFFIVSIYFSLINYFSVFYNQESTFFIFTKPDLISLPTYGFIFLSFIFIFYENLFFKFHNLIKFAIVIIFIVTNILFSFHIVDERVNPPYVELTEEEVSIYIKYKLVEYLGPIILKSENLSPSISYQLGGGKFEWIDKHGSQLNEWYPLNVYTIGRTFDYILYKEWGIVNLYEGNQERFFTDSDYIISFTKDKLISDDNIFYKNINFGPLRLSINE